MITNIKMQNVFIASYMLFTFLCYNLQAIYSNSLQVHAHRALHKLQLIVFISYIGLL